MSSLHGLQVLPRRQSTLSEVLPQVRQFGATARRRPAKLCLGDVSLLPAALSVRRGQQAPLRQLTVGLESPRVLAELLPVWLKLQAWQQNTYVAKPVVGFLLGSLAPFCGAMLGCVGFLQEKGNCWLQDPHLLPLHHSLQRHRLLAYAATGTLVGLVVVLHASQSLDLHRETQQGLGAFALSWLAMCILSKWPWPPHR